MRTNKSPQIDMIFVTAVADYHEFKNVVRYFQDAGIKLKFEEVGTGISDYWPGPHRGYHAVFYNTTKRQAEPLIKEWKNILS